MGDSEREEYFKFLEEQREIEKDLMNAFVQCVKDRWKYAIRVEGRDAPKNRAQRRAENRRKHGKV